MCWFEWPTYTPSDIAGGVAWGRAYRAYIKSRACWDSPGLDIGDVELFLHTWSRNISKFIVSSEKLLHTVK
jgi:hypothetical protein